MVSSCNYFQSIDFYMYSYIDIKKIHVGKELIKIVFFSFKCKIMLYMLTHVF
jgi:hypothetical protein